VLFVTSINAMTASTIVSTQFSIVVGFISLIFLTRKTNLKKKHFKYGHFPYKR